MSSTDPSQDLRSGASVTDESLWHRLNSPISIWLLSSVVLGLISFSWGTLKESLKESHERLQRTEMIDTEIESRLVQWYSIAKTPSNKALYAGQFFNFYINLIKPPGRSSDNTDSIYPAYREFDQTPFLSLVLELRSILPAPGDRELDDLPARISALRYETTANSPYDKNVSRVLSELWIDRWHRPPSPSKIR